MRKIIIFGIGMERLAFLENATNIGYTLNLNAIHYARFTMPIDDAKNRYCAVHNFVELWENGRRVELFRIIGTNLTRPNFIEYECEHVITTLIDNVLFRFHTIGNIGTFTNTVLNYILGRQSVQNWRLGVCDFRHQFLYKWENENLLAALFSVPKPFLDKYMWTYDTTTRPWTLNLRRIDERGQIECELRYMKNMQEIQKTVDATNILTRLYPLGYGEGNNQLGIEAVNGGKPYIEADAATLAAYGVKESIWVDRRFENVENLKSTAESILKELSVPYVSYAVTALDLFKMSKDDFDDLRPGKLVRVIDKEDGINVNAFIVSVEKPDIAQAAVNVVIANKDRDVAGSISDLAERTRINELYAQGSANLLTMNYLDNADSANPAVFEFFIPADMVNINQALLRVQLLRFRGYSRAIQGGGSVATSSGSGGGSTVTSTSGGGTSTSTTSGGGSTATSSSGGGQSATSSSGGGQNSTTTTSAQISNSTMANSFSAPATWNHPSGVFVFNGEMASATVRIGAEGSTVTSNPHMHQIRMWTTSWSHSHNNPPHQHQFTIPGHNHQFTVPAHTHNISVQAHTHNVTIQAHNHSVTIAAHSHNISLSPHTHTITLPNHTHGIEFGIFMGTVANSIQLRVDGTAVSVPNLNNIDIARFLRTDGGGRILRNAWHRIEIIPNQLTRISANLFLNIFTNPRTNLNL
ncbi:MAG: phage tail protein [Turicibacter sp.]|nr:phage tail protein [Turicibacter sp.]